MLKISVNKFKKQYLHIEKKYVDKNLCCYLNKYNNQVKESLKYIFPYITDNDAEMFLKYINYSNIEYSNRLNFMLDKSLFNDYINSLDDNKILVDIKRLSFTKKFIHECDGLVKKVSTIKTIDTKDLEYIAEDDLYFYNYNQIVNKNKFMNKILSSKPFFKYLLHQDIHNSILNPILVSIMLLKHYENLEKSENYEKKDNNSTIIQLRDIKQIYKNIDFDNSKIEMIYFVKKFFILDTTLSELPIEKKIHPYLIIKCEMELKDNHILINITF